MPEKRRAATAGAARRKAQEPDSETVPASEIVTGDQVWMPNSRHPQEVLVISRVTSPPAEEDGDPIEHLRINAGDATWTVPPTAEIRRVVK